MNLDVRSRHHSGSCSGQMNLRYYLTITVTILATSFAQRADFELPPNQLNRRFSFSTTAPLSRAINELTPEAIPHIELMNHHMSRVEVAVLESVKRERLHPEAIAQPCNPLIRHSYRMSVFRAFAVRGFLEPAWNCGSDVSGVRVTRGEAPGYTLNDLYNAVFARGAIIKKRVNEVARRLIDNFTQPEVPFNFTYNTVSAECVLSPVCMYREGEFWHQGIGIHSHGRDEYVPDGNRNSIIEHFRVVDGRLGDILLMRLPKYDNGSVERVFEENCTTMIQTWSRTPNPSCFKVIPIEENPAVLQALDDVDHSSQQAEDALTSSNLAILLLPLGLNLVPIAFVAHVGTRMMFLYTVMSDVLTVIPLAIKGLELVIIRSNRFRSVVTRVLSPGFGNLTHPLAAGGEIWAAECRVREGVGRTGIVLIVTSVVFMCFGVAAEILARWFVKRKMRRRARWGLVSEDSWGHISGESSGEISGNWSELLSYDVGFIGVEERYSMDRSYMRVQ